MTILLGIDMIAVVVVMLGGAIGMTAQNRDPRRSNRLMRARVALQGLGIALLVLLLVTG